MHGRIYDAVLLPFEKAQLKTIRRDLLSRAHGRTLEIGAGTGLNFPFYPADASVTASDPDVDMLERAKARIQGLHKGDKIRAVELDAQSLPFSDEEFDTVVATLVFCSIPDPNKALQEAHRVLKPGGRFLLLEHIRKNTPIVGRLQDALTPAWRMVAGNCHLNRNPEPELIRLGFQVIESQTLWKDIGKLWVLVKPEVDAAICTDETASGRS